MTLPAASSKIGVSRCSGPWPTPQVVPGGSCRRLRHEDIPVGRERQCDVRSGRGRERSVACTHRPRTTVPGDRPHRAHLLADGQGAAARAAAPGSRAGYAHRVLEGIVWRTLFFAAAGLLLAACAGSAPPPSFDPATPCGGVDQQQMKGAYPDLEARVPTRVDGQAADSRDSGRFCSKATLGTLWDAGIHEKQLGGGIWVVEPTGGTSLAGLQLSVFRAPGLTAQLQADEYRSGASGTSRVTIVSATNEVVNGRPGYRINLLNGDSHQAIVVWPSADGRSSRS